MFYQELMVSSLNIIKTTCLVKLTDFYYAMLLKIRTCWIIFRFTKNVVRVTCAETLCVCDTCVERFGLAEMCGSLLCGCFLGWDGSVSNCGKVADASPGNNTCGPRKQQLYFFIVTTLAPKRRWFTRFVFCRFHFVNCVNIFSKCDTTFHDILKK